MREINRITKAFTVGLFMRQGTINCVQVLMQLYSLILSVVLLLLAYLRVLRNDYVIAVIMITDTFTYKVATVWSRALK